MTTVSCVGLAVLDQVFIVDELPFGPHKHFALDRRRAGGGPAAVAAVTAAKLGAAARFVGRVGDDPAGTDLLDWLHREGVDTSGSRAVMGARTPLSAVFVDAGGERMVVNHTDPALFEGETVAATDLGEADAVLVDVFWPAGAEMALRIAADRGIPGVVDFDFADVDAGRLLDHASHVVFSQAALMEMTGMANLPAAVVEIDRRTAAKVAVTAGQQGLWWVDKEIRRMPAFDVEPRDTLGAGDVFHGAFTVALAEGRPLQEALRFASAAGAARVADGSIPDRSRVESIMEGP